MTARLVTRVPALVVALVLGALLVQATGLPVTRTRGLDAAYAERMDLGDILVVSGTTLEIFPAETNPRPGSALLGPPCVENSAAPVFFGGVASCPAELAEVAPLAWSALAVGNWVYTVTLRERSASSAPAGSAFVVELLYDGVSRGSVYVTQSVANDRLAESASVAFDIGRAAPKSPQFVILVRSAQPIAGSYTLRAVNDVDLQFRWQGQGGETDGQMSPTLHGTVGAPLSIRNLYDEVAGGTHNLRVKDPSNAVIAGPTSNIDTDHREALLEWTPTDAGTFRYECKYHFPSQFGSIEITTE
jgi:hypothetical protein